ncbi:MAG: MBL fold metallo-hydrolase [Syntrophobacterales bacterium]|jgi:glyoxylase-like metal-dependent hydrolase (beta-lactamase superfamily II)|nr:MBL fold metallo-hydrolase [Syntrophobacterales bacterium]
MEVLDGLYAFTWQSFHENNCNTYFINREKKILIDPGHDHLFSHVADKLGELNILPSQLDYVLITHGHPDHLEAAFRLQHPSSMAMSREEWQFIQQWAGSNYNLPPPDLFLEEGPLPLGDVTLEVYHTPGHSPGSVCLYWPEHKVLFTGDVIFNQGIGRVDLPQGNGAQLKESIRRLRKLDVEILLSGHGEILAGKEAVQENFRFIENYWFRYI